MTKRIFITATDTDAGKTLISSALLYLLTKSSKVAAFKPVSAGCEEVDGKLINEDADYLQTLANCNQTIESVNPIAFKEAIAPHIAAQSLGQTIAVDDVVDHFKKLKEYSPEYILTEGAGGWRLPLGNQVFLSDFAKQTNQDVILVVNMKLGCLNHALLTFEAIKNDGLNCVAWIANCHEDMPFLQENIAELKGLLSAPCIGVVPTVKNYIEASSYITINNIF